VIADFPKPPVCGCKDKPGTVTQKKFNSVCELKKYSAENNEGKLKVNSNLTKITQNYLFLAYTNYVYTPKKKTIKICKLLQR